MRNNNIRIRKITKKAIKVNKINKININNKLINKARYKNFKIKEINQIINVKIMNVIKIFHQI